MVISTRIMALLALTAVIAAFAAAGQSHVALAASQGGFQSMGTPQAYNMGLSIQQTRDNIMSVAEGMPDISMFVSAVKAAGLGDRLKAQKEFLIFAPTDQAIKKDPAIGSLSSMSGTKLSDIVQNCIVNKVAMPYQGGKEIKLTTLGGKEIVFKMSGDRLTAGGANVVKIIKADNGIIAVTDGVPRV